MAEGVAMFRLKLPRPEKLRRLSSSKARPRYSNCRGPLGDADNRRDSLETPRGHVRSLKSPSSIHQRLVALALQSS